MTALILKSCKIMWNRIALIVGLIGIAQSVSAVTECNNTLGYSLEESTLSMFSTRDFERLRGCLCNESSSVCSLRITRCLQQIYYITSILSTTNVSANYIYNTTNFVCHVAVVSYSSRGNITCCRENSPCASNNQDNSLCGTSSLNVTQKTPCACLAMSFDHCRNQTANSHGINVSLVDDSLCLGTEEMFNDNRHELGMIVGLSAGIFVVLVIIVAAGLMCRRRARKKNKMPSMGTVPNVILSSPNIYSTAQSVTSHEIKDRDAPNQEILVQTEPGKSYDKTSNELSNRGYTVVNMGLSEIELKDNEKIYICEQSSSVIKSNDNMQVVKENYTDKLSDIEVSENELNYPETYEGDGSYTSTSNIDDEDDDDYSKLRRDEKNVKNPYNTLLNQRQDPKLRQPMSRPSDSKLATHEVISPATENGTEIPDSTLSDNRPASTYEQVLVIDVSSNPDVESVTKTDDYDYPAMYFPPTKHPLDNMDDYTTPGDVENSDPYSFPANEFLQSSNVGQFADFGKFYDVGQSSYVGRSSNLDKSSELGQCSVISGDKRDHENRKNDDPLYLLNKILNNEVPCEAEVEYSPINYGKDELSI